MLVPLDDAGHADLPCPSSSVGEVERYESDRQVRVQLGQPLLVCRTASTVSYPAAVDVTPVVLGSGSEVVSPWIPLS